MFLPAAIHENRCSERKWPREKFSRRDTRQREAQLRYKTRERPRSQARNRRDTKVPRIRDFKEKRRHSPWKNCCRKTTTFNPRGKPKREAASEPIRQSWELPGSWLTSSAWHAVLFHSPVPHDARTSNRFTRNKERPRASNWLHLLLGRFFSGIYNGRKRTFPRITLCFLGTICDSLSTTHRLAVKMNGQPRVSLWKIRGRNWTNIMKTGTRFCLSLMFYFEKRRLRCEKNRTVLTSI